MLPRPLLVGLPGLTLDAAWAKVLQDLQPCGYILFRRNCQSSAQVAALVARLRDLHPYPLRVLVDQEGGRVNRLNWLPYQGPAPQRLGQLYQVAPATGLRAAYLNALLLGGQLRQLGIDTNCFPLADVLTPATHAVIGDRAFGADPYAVAALCRASIAGLQAGGCYPVLKHAPGHGRATADSHLTLPRVEAAAALLASHDFIPFRHNHDCPFVMTAHVHYPALDPQHCATHSATVMQQVLRQQLGLTGLIMSDDVYMAALSGPLPVRTQQALDAGCDLALVCQSVLPDLLDLTRTIAPCTAAFWQRWQALPALTPATAAALAAAQADLSTLAPQLLAA